MMEKLTIIACFTLLVLLSISSPKVNESNTEYKNYCELVLMWEEDAELGVEPTRRDGHPNYKEINCEL